MKEGDQVAPRGQGKSLWFLPYLDESKPWRSRHLLPVKPEGVELAVRDRRGKVKAYASQADFQEAVTSPTDLRHQRVAIPAYNRWFPAILLWEPREDVKANAAGDVIKPLLITLLLGWLYLAPPAALPLGHPQTRMFLLLGLMFFGLMPLGTEAIRWWEDWRDRAPDRNKRRQVDLVLFDHWLNGFSPWVLRATLGLFALVYLLQVFGGGLPRMALDQALAALFLGGGGVSRSVQEAALVHGRVLRDGEWWRLITGGVMHGSLLHIIFNGAALYFLGRVTIAMVGAALLGFVFFTSIAAGSLASLWLSGGLPSVGASGGVMGILGFLTVILVFRDAGIPRLYKTNLVQAILIISIFGALGAQFIDNAGHAGGFAAGGVWGMLLVPRSERVWEHQSPLWLRLLGWMSWGFLVAASIFVMVRILT